MASLIHDGGKRWRVSIIDGTGRRRTLRLKASDSAARATHDHIEHLEQAAGTRHTPPPATARWLADLDDRWHAKLARLGLVEPRGSATLGGWLKTYLDEKRAELKPESLRKLEQTATKLLEHLGADKPLRSITPAQAAAWRAWLTSSGLSVASVKTHVGNCKSIFREAAHRGLVDKSPFERLKGGSTPSSVDRFITREEIESVIEACPTVEYRLLFGLARYAGLRCPSESHLLTWADVDFDEHLLHVKSPKTERHGQGHDSRTVPVEPRLMALIQEAYDLAPEGQERLIVGINGKGALRRRVEAIWTRAGVQPWDRLFQSLRSSCERDWAQHHPQVHVSRWIGHGMLISAKHYLNGDLPEAYARVTGVPNSTLKNHVPQVSQKRAQTGPETGCHGLSGATSTFSGNGDMAGNDRQLQLVSTNDTNVDKWSRGESNPRPVADE
ncbi:MAG: tyrosine-type recombinase/integrase [Phycisphaeraceae bacterium]|nr:tyrosine-type recombinase/integrase [Phycisphaeraceae bacterium]